MYQAAHGLKYLPERNHKFGDYSYMINITTYTYSDINVILFSLFVYLLDSSLI